jgi:hypothetical protein
VSCTNRNPVFVSALFRHLYLTWRSQRRENCPGQSRRPRRLAGRTHRQDRGGRIHSGGHKNGDLYCWGSPPKGFQILDELDATPDLVEIDGGKEVVDVAVGMAHMLVLTGDGEVYGIGSNENGQLGLGEEAAGEGARLAAWTKLDTQVTTGYKITGVVAGPMNSFVLAQSNGKEEL